MKFSRLTEELLLKSGWSEERKIDIKKIEEGLAFEGYELNTKICDFLERFGELKVYHPKNYKCNIQSYFHFNAVFAAESIYRDIVKSYEKRIQESLVVIGMADSDNWFLMMSESGKVFSSFDDDLIQIGDNYIQAIENLCQNKRDEFIIID